MVILFDKTEVQMPSVDVNLTEVFVKRENNRYSITTKDDFLKEKKKSEKRTVKVESDGNGE